MVLALVLSRDILKFATNAIVSLRPFWNQRICFLVHSHECWQPSLLQLAVGQILHLFARDVICLPCEILNRVLTTWQLLFPKARDPRERKCLRQKLKVFVS